MIIAKLIGGLGNQMFQYALGRHLAERNQAELKLDITGFEKYKLHRYSLSHFNIIENFATKEEVKKFQKYNRKPGRQWFLYNKLIANEKKYASEKQFHFNQKILNLKPPVFIDGYWQTEKYFKDIEPVIRKEFGIKHALSGKNLEVAQKIEVAEAISIHIRRGDYVTNASTNQYHGTCDLAYYREAISIIAQKVKNPHFFIFSDDQNWVKENLKLSYPKCFVDHNDARTNYEDLRLMSICKHNIIANSSFSWWGAWLNNNPNKIVVAPKQWFKTKKMNTIDLIPETWIKI